MNQIVDRLLSEDFDYERGSLDFSCPRLEITIQKGEVYEDSFMIYGLPEKFTKGYVLTSDSRMECFTKEFCGSEEEIHFRFKADGLEEGDVVKGEFYVISNQGEYYLPYVVSVAYHILDSSLGPIKNLFHFANLAKTNMDEAMKLFYSPHFKQIFNGNDKQYLKIYEGLSKYKGNGQNLEEFLLVINKKQKIEYLVKETSLHFENITSRMGEELVVTKNGWGFATLNVEVDGAFINVYKTCLTDDDFVDNYCSLYYEIDEEKLHAGKNYGAIRLYNHDVDIVVEVTVVQSKSRRLKKARECERKQTVCKLMEYYQQMRLKKINTGKWLAETEKAIEKLLSLDDKSIVTRLFQAHVLITKERFNEAKWVLDRVADFFEEEGSADPALFSYYLYLTTLYRRDEAYTKEMAAVVSDIYIENRGNWRIAWLLLYMDEDYGKNLQKKWNLLEEQFQYGCSSPIIYAEATQLVLTNPTILLKLGEFEMQVLRYMAKHHVLHVQTAIQIQNLVQKEKQYNEKLLYILQECYKVDDSDDTLLAICSVLMKGGLVGKTYFSWYAEAVKRDLRLTKLYEYYMLSVDLETVEALPKVVAMYFSYHSDLDYERNAFLYANIYKFQDDMPEVYRSCEMNIKKFVEEQIVKGHINRNLAYLYKNVVTIQGISVEMANKLAKLLFVHQIEIEQDYIRNVIVYYPRCAKEAMFPVVNGRAYVPLYDSDCTVLFEDGEGNRYQYSVSYTVERFLIPGKVAKMIQPYVHEQVGFAAYICQAGGHHMLITEENLPFYLQLLRSDKVEEAYKEEITMKLVPFYYETDRIAELDSFLEEVPPNGLNMAERAEMVRFLVMRGFYKKAYEWLKTWGSESVDAKVLVRLCDRLLENDDYTQDTFMCKLIMQAFRRGKYNEALLEFLMQNYSGMTKELRDIWKATNDFEVDNFILSEKILLQILYTGSHIGEKMDIFKSYVSHGGKMRVEKAFLAQNAYDFFVKEKIQQACLFEEIARLELLGEEIPYICKLGFVKYYAENKEELQHILKDERVYAVFGHFFDDIIKNRMPLSCFKEYGDTFPVLKQFSDKTIIEYRAHPDSRAILHYVIEREDNDEETSEYHTETMRNVYGGVFVKDFVLFFGEKLQYYIMEEHAGEEQLTESNCVQKSDIMEGANQYKFAHINDLVISKVLQDYDTVDALLAEYYYKEFQNEKLFRLK